MFDHIRFLRIVYKYTMLLHKYINILCINIQVLYMHDETYQNSTSEKYQTRLIYIM